MNNIENNNSGAESESLGLTELERRFAIRHSLELLSGKIELLLNSMIIFHKKQTTGETLAPDEIRVIKNAYNYITDFLVPVINTADKNIISESTTTVQNNLNS